MLFRVNYDGVPSIFIVCEDVDRVLKELHDGHVGGNFMGNNTTHKILRAGYYWSTLFRDAHTYARNCKTCQISAGRVKRLVVPLQTMAISEPFKQWGLDIIGEITLTSSKQHRYILTATNYFTKWVEAIPLTPMNEKVLNGRYDPIHIHPSDPIHRKIFITGRSLKDMNRS
jgi:hypothetical protein